MSEVFEANFSNMSKNLKRLKKKIPEQFRQARREADIVFLTWMNEGSKNDPTRPPIMEGTLRGQSFAFTDGELASSRGGVPGGTVESLIGDPKDVSTYVWNTPYAHRQHEEWKEPGGPASQQDGAVGNKWIEKHLRADKGSYMASIANRMKRFANND
jgi:hypothetical protein